LPLAHYERSSGLEWAARPLCDTLVEDGGG
jgi:hypothetical protein